MAGIDSNTVLMLHGNGTNGSTTITDDSASGHSVSVFGAAKLNTSQKEFGSASIEMGATYGIPGGLVIPDSDDFSFGNGDFTFDTWVNFTSFGPGTSYLFQQYTDSSNHMEAYITLGGGTNTQIWFSETSGGVSHGNYNITSGMVISLNTWYHLAIVRSGNSCLIFWNGVSHSLTTVSAFSSTALGNFTGNFYIGIDNTEFYAYSIPGYMDEIRLSKGIARWTTDFTPPVAEYSSQTDNTVIPSLLTLTTILYSPIAEAVSIVTPSVLTLTSTVNDVFIDYTLYFYATVLNLVASLEASDNSTHVDYIPDTLNLVSHTILPKFPGLSVVQNAVKIISYNPLVIITGNNPLTIAEIDTTLPDAPAYNVVTCPGVYGANDVVVDTILGAIYVSCNNGKIVKFNLDNFSTYTIYDTGISNNILHLTGLSGYGLIAGSSNSRLGELVSMDESIVNVLVTDIRWLQEINSSISCSVNIIQAQQLNTDIRWLSETSSVLGIDIRFTTVVPGTPYTPISRLDFRVILNGVECTDCKMDAISVYHTDFEKSKATFVLARQHDNLDYTLDGVYSQITNKNPVQVIINGNVEFDGFIWNLDTNSDTESIKVEAYTTDFAPTNKGLVTLSIPSINEQFSLHHVIVENPIINNPYILATDKNPPLFLGVAAPAGTSTRGGALVSGTLEVGNSSHVFGTYLSPSDALSDGSFIPTQNWTYFWHPIVENFMTGKVYNEYIGTSLGSVSGDTWEMTKLTYFKQIHQKDIVTQLGGHIPPESEFGYNRYLELNRGYYFTRGTAPFKIVGGTNGEYSSGGYYEDNGGALEFVIPAGYNYTPYVNQILDMEYKKLQNINGSILPETAVDMQILIDTYYYYRIKMLNRLNIDNTIALNIYNNNNGFPVSVKSIEINSGSMKVNLHCDNKWSRQELIDIEYTVPMLDIYDPQYPKKPLNYRTLEQRSIVAFKFDINKQIQIDMQSGV